MSDAPAEPSPSEPTAEWAALQRPRAVKVAAVVTWVGSTIAAAMALLLAASVLFGGTSVRDSLGLASGSVVPWIVSTVVDAVGVALVADLAAYFLLRRRRWAWWVLVVLAIITTLFGAQLALVSVVGAVAVIASVSVLVMLLAPRTRTWLKEPDPEPDPD